MKQNVRSQMQNGNVSGSDPTHSVTVSETDPESIRMNLADGYST